MPEREVREVAYKEDDEAMKENRSTAAHSGSQLVWHRASWTSSLHPSISIRRNMDPDTDVLPPPATPPPRPSKRSNQLVGVHFESPKRRRPWLKDSQLVLRPGLARQELELTAKLNKMLGKIGTGEQSFPSLDSTDEQAGPENAREPSPTPPTEHVANSDTQERRFEDEPHTRRLLPDEVAQRLYSNWLNLMPTLHAEYLAYLERTQGRLGRFRDDDHLDLCTSRLCTTKEASVQCLYFDCLLALLNVNLNC